MATIGAIRYTWMYATPGINGGVNAFDSEEEALSPSAYQAQAPFYSTVNSSNSITITPGNQALMDQELEMAYRCGVDYFAFDFYPNASGYLAGTNGLWTGINSALALYLASPNKSLVKFCLILVGGHGATPNPITQANWSPIADQIVTYMLDSQYMIAHPTLLGLANRKILYMFATASFITDSGGQAAANARLDELFTKATTAGLLTPYVGSMDSSLISGMGFKSAYTVFIGSSGNEISQATYQTNNESAWAALVAGAGGLGIIPATSLGWDIRARYDSGFSCAQPELTPYACTLGDYTALATPAQVAERVSSAIEFIEANPTECNSEHLLINSWDENSETGNSLCPNRTDKGMNLQTMALALGRQREHKNSLRSRGIPVLSR